MQNYDLNDDNFRMLAIKNYNTSTYLMDEFDDDLKRLKSIKKLISRYRNTDTLNERLILNHIIILSNTFGVEFTTRMLFYKLDQESHSVIKPFLLLLNYLPEYIDSIKGEIIYTNEIIMDQKVIEQLRNI